MVAIVDDIKDIKRRLRGDDWWTARKDQALSQPAKVYGTIHKSKVYTPSPYDLVDGGTDLRRRV